MIGLMVIADAERRLRAANAKVNEAQRLLKEAQREQAEAFDDLHRCYKIANGEQP